jgi:predicted phage tail component-like protein
VADTTFFTFAGVTDLSMGLVVDDCIRAMAPPQTIVSQQVPGRRGAYFQRVQDEVREFGLKVWHNGTSSTDANAIRRALAAWLILDAPAELTFEDEPGIVWMAMLSGTTDLAEIATLRRGTLTFVCFDPDGIQAAETTADIATGTNTLLLYGQRPTRPRVELSFSDAATFAMIRHQETGRYVLVGTPPSVDDTPAVDDPARLHNECVSVAGIPDGLSADGGTVPSGAAMVSNGHSISPLWAGGSFGAGASWHGPTKRYALSAAAADFRLTADLGISEAFALTGSAAGRIEIYLLDETDAVFAKVAVKDSWQSVQRLGFEARIGYYGQTNPSPRYLSVGTAPIPSLAHGGLVALAPSRVILERIGHVWRAKLLVAGAGGRWLGRPYGIEASWTDTADVFAHGDHALASVDVHIAAIGTQPELSAMYVSHLEVREILTPSPVPMIFDATGTLVIDCYTHKVTWDGDDDVMRYLDPSSEFFDLPTGTSHLQIWTNTGVAVAGHCYTRRRYI